MYSCLCGKLTDEFTAQMGEYLAHHTSLSTKMTELLMLYKHQMAPMAEIVADREDPMKIKLLFSQDDNGLVSRDSEMSFASKHGGRFCLTPICILLSAQSTVGSE